MIDEIDEPIQRFTADGAYDRLSIYEALDEADTEDVEVGIRPELMPCDPSRIPRPGTSAMLPSTSSTPKLRLCSHRLAY